MNRWRVKRGNTSVQEIEVRDKDDQLVTNLSTATDIKFQIKERKSNSIMIEKTKGDGIAFNEPSTGYLTITLLPTDTDIDDKKYVMALELIWSAIIRYETRLYINGSETYDFVIEKQTIE